MVASETTPPQHVDVLSLISRLLAADETGGAQPDSEEFRSAQRLTGTLTDQDDV